MIQSQTSDNMDGWKRRGGKSQRRELKAEERRSSCAKRSIVFAAPSAGSAKVEKTCGSKGSKSRLAKAAGAEPFR